jgi:carboxyl-terminal processing protease
VLKGFEQPATFSGVGVEVSKATEGLQVQRVFDSSPAQRSGLREGEVITAVNGRSLHGVATEAAQKLITGQPGTEVHLTLSDGKGSRTVTVTREVITEPVVASTVYTVHGHRLGWLYLASFSEGSQEQVRHAVHQLLAEHVAGLVFDLRGNGGGLVSEARMIASVFIKSGVIVTTKGRTQPTDTITAAGDAIAPTIPLVVLVDHFTASASEIVTAALQDHHRATVVGTHTYGKGVYQELEPLSNGAALKVTVGEYFTPNGRNLGGRGVSQGAGVIPEVPVGHGVDTDRGLTVALHTLANKLA